MTLKELFESKGFTSYQISKITGIGETTLSSWTTGKVPIDNIRFGHIISLCNALSISIDEFVTLID